MSNTGSSVKWNPIREIDASLLTNVYQPIGTVFLQDCFMIWFLNNTNADVYLSVNGTFDQIKLPMYTGRSLDLKTNDMYLIAGTQFYIRLSQIGPASGWFSIEAEFC